MVLKNDISDPGCSILRQNPSRNDVCPQPRRADPGYALISVLFLVLILSVFSTVIIRSDLFFHDRAVSAVCRLQSAYAANNGIELATALVSSGACVDTSLTVNFPDGSGVRVTILQWGLYSYVMSHGFSDHSATNRFALIGDHLTTTDGPALVLGNVSHGLIVAGKTRIIGDVVVGNRGVSTGSLKNEPGSFSIPVDGRITKIASSRRILDTLAIDREVVAAELMLRAMRPKVNPGFSDAIVDTAGYIDLSDLSDSIGEIFSNGSLTLAGEIMKRGPPLSIVSARSLHFLPGSSLAGPIAIYSADSISIPSQVKLVNSIVVSARSISLKRGASVTAQLFAPVIRFESNTSAGYPSVLVSVSLSDTSGVEQSIDLAPGSSVTGAVVMKAGSGLSLQKALIDIEPGAVVTGEVCTNAYLTMDGKVDGLVRTFDLYFYDSPTTYVGWLRMGVIDREHLPYGFLKPIGISDGNKGAILEWM